MTKRSGQQLDLFVLPLGDVDLRDQQDTMESPFFALNKGRKTPLEYRSPNGKVDVTISPNVMHGMANIWDADILIWAAGTVNRMQTRGDRTELDQLDRTRTLHFHPVDLLRSIKRGTSGKDIQDLRAALERLASTYIKTNIREHHQQGGRTRQGFTWIDAWSEVTAEDANGKERVVGFTLTLSNWFYMGVVQQKMLLSVDPAYFDLTGGYERWLYRIARKHAHGAPEGWNFTLTTLHQKSGSDAPKKAFKRDFKKIADRGGILGYGIEWTDRGRGQDPLIRIFPDPENAHTRQLSETHKRIATRKAANAAVQSNPADYRQLLDPITLARLASRYPGENLENLLSRFVAWNAKKGTKPRDFAKAFEGFIEKDRRSR